MKISSMITIVSGAVVLAVALLSQRHPGSAAAAIPAPRTQWEYGIYQVDVGDHTYEWMDRTQHVYAPTRQAFFEKMGVSNFLSKMEPTYVNTSPPFPSYLVDTAFINYLGSRGWELVDGWGFDKYSSHVFTFKRIVQH